MALFPTTTWSTLNLLHRGHDEDARAALGRLCELYWQPLYGYLRGSRQNPEEAKDLVQSYFVHLLESKALSRVDPSKGRFRSFLIASLKNFVANQRRHANAQKRAPEAGFVSLDVDGAEHRYIELARDELTPEQQFERNWAITLIERGVERLRDEECKAGRETAFEAVSAHVLGAGKRPPYRQVAAGLGISEAAVKVRVSRMRKRLGRLLYEEVRSTVAAEDDVAGELRHLLALWGEARV